MADFFIAGGADFNMNNYLINSVERLGHQSNVTNPANAIRPFDQSRNGAGLSDGGGFLILEEYESAIKRKAPIKCEVLGFHSTCEASHPLQPNYIGMYKAI